MSERIYKYPIVLDDEQGIDMPRGATVLHVATQGEGVFIWALVDTDAPERDRRFAVRGTGHPCRGLESAPYVGTVHLAGGSLVFHIFDRGETTDAE